MPWSTGLTLSLEQAERSWVLQVQTLADRLGKLLEPSQLSSEWSRLEVPFPTLSGCSSSDLLREAEAYTLESRLAVFAGDPATLGEPTGDAAAKDALTDVRRELRQINESWCQVTGAPIPLQEQLVVGECSAGKTRVVSTLLETAVHPKLLPISSPEAQTKIPLEVVFGNAVLTSRSECSSCSPRRRSWCSRGRS